jgi:threonine/homoserine/homoserine lactone efflux protein
MAGGGVSTRHRSTKVHKARICHDFLMPIDLHLLLLFTVTTLVAMITPGPDMLFVLGCGIRGGARAGLLATAGVAASEAVHVAVAAAGLAALFEAVPVAFTVVRIAGAIYLVYLGVQMLRSRKGMESELPAAGQGAGMPGRRAFTSGLLTNLLNPKMVTFTIAFLPQFINPHLGQVWLQFAILGAILIAMEFLVDGTVGVLAGRIGGWLRRRRAARRKIDIATGGIFIGLGVKLAVER